MEQANNVTTNRELQIRKILSAPIEMVWETWTNTEHIAHWWGPSGFTNTIHEMDVSAGGEWRLTMHGPDGKRYPNKSLFLEVVPFKKIVFQHFNPNYVATILFEPQERGTLLEWTMLFETQELFDSVVKVFKAGEGLKQNVEKLENYLSERIQ
ncbi:MAG: SRPBCC domain-containing protein [Chitinophagaceae bacterium]|nr:SRPBCC domain-containing protein [Chitinophagaceae bacterium]